MYPHFCYQRCDHATAQGNDLGALNTPPRCTLGTGGWTPASREEIDYWVICLEDRP